MWPFQNGRNEPVEQRPQADGLPDHDHRRGSDCFARDDSRQGGYGSNRHSLLRARAPLDDRGRCVATPARGNQLIAKGFRIRDAHEHDESVGDRKSGGRLARSRAVAGDDRDRHRHATRGQWNSRVRGGSDGRRHAGDDLERHVGAPESQRFVGAPPEDERIATFETYDALAGPRERDELPLDRGLICL